MVNEQDCLSQVLGTSRSISLTSANPQVSLLSVLEQPRCACKRTSTELNPSAPASKRIAPNATRVSYDSVMAPLPTTGSLPPATSEPPSKAHRRNSVAVAGAEDVPHPAGSSAVRRSRSSSPDNVAVTDLRRKLATAEADIAKLEQVMSQILLKEQTITRLQALVDCYRETDAMKNDQISAMRSALDAEKSKSAMLQITVERLTNESQVLGKKIENLRMALGTEKSKSISLQNKVEQLTTDLNESEEEVDDLRTLVAIKCDEISRKDQQIRSMNAVVDEDLIRVAVRVRPPIGKEVDLPPAPIRYPSLSSLALGQGRKCRFYDFQCVFGPRTSQARLFGDLEKTILSCLNGYNVSVIAYGPTGSGKTYTMRGGDNKAEGIIPRALKYLLQSRDDLSHLDWDFEFEASFLEVYDELAYDLLADRKWLYLRKGRNDKLIGFERRKIVKIVSQDDIELILETADRARTTPTENQRSSRSHAIFELAIKGSNTITGARRHASLHLVDLAGSEEVKQSGREVNGYEGAVYITSALFNLQKCIRSQLKQDADIPYHNSWLTYFLRDTLGAKGSRTVFIVTVNPTGTDIAETRRSLCFAQRMSLTAG